MQAAAALVSPARESFGLVTRAHDARRLNEIVNDPSVYRWVRGAHGGVIDLSGAVANPANYALLGDHGGVFFHQLQPGLYEAHTQVLPPGRGKWCLQMARDALHFMFTRTDAVEIVTKCPTRQAKAVAVALRMSFEFTSQKGWVMDGTVVPADIYAMRIQDWFRTAPRLEERGHWFHEKLEQEYERHGKQDPSPHEDDAVHDRYVGGAIEIILGGEPFKGVVFYNRWAAIAGYAPVEICARSPLTIDIRDAILIVRDNDFWVATCR